MDNIQKLLNKYKIDFESYNKESKTLNIKKLDCTNLLIEDFIILNEIEYITGELYLTNKELEDFSFFNYLKGVKKLVINDCKKLKLLTGFNALKLIDSLIISKNFNLEEIFGFNSLFSQSDILNKELKIINNIKLKNIYFLRGLKQVNSSLYLHYNALETLEGLEQLEHVNASFSISSNNLKSLKPLSNLKFVNGMIGVVNNKLKSLAGLENLEHLKTIKWNGKLRTIALNKNPYLSDIKALNNISEVSGNCIVIVDSSQKFKIIPSKKSIFSYNNIIVYAQDIDENISKSNICDLSVNLKSRFLDIREEFILDDDWRPNLKYLEYVFLRGREGDGTQLKRIDLVRWQDKVYIHHFLKEHGIPSMPIIMYSHRQDEDFFERIEQLYKNGLKSFVIKSTHLANSNGVYRIRNGKFISANDTAKKNEMYGKDVDFEYLKKEINKKWLEKQIEEDWSSMMVNPGVILEELIEDSIELKFSIVFGEVVGFFARVKGFPSFDANGKLLSNNKGVLPYWWKEAKILALKVAKLVKADHIRIDVFYFNNQPIINEITWNGGERREITGLIAKKLNEGYSQRLHMLGKKVIDIKNNNYVEKFVNKNEFISFSTKTNIPGKFNVIETKFIIVDINTNPRFYWMNTKKFNMHYDFYKNNIDMDCVFSKFRRESYTNSQRKNIVGSLIYHDLYSETNEKGIYTIHFWPTVAILFHHTQLAWNMLTQRIKFAKDNIFIHTISDIQKQQVLKDKKEYDKSNIRFIKTDTLFNKIDYIPYNNGTSYGILRFASNEENFDIKDIVVFDYIPNYLSHVSGILTTLPQTSLSHINLLAKQNKIPNAYLKNASIKEELLLLKDCYVRYEINNNGYKISKATKKEVESFFDKIRPLKELIPKSNLQEKEIKHIRNINNKDFDAYGTKTSNLGELYNIFSEENIPDGFGIPFYFYDQFLKYNDFYKEIEILCNKYKILENIQEKEILLKEFRNKIRNGKVAQWMENEFNKILGYYPKNSYLRLRSSANNEDLKNFSGAGLYDSYSYKDFSKPLSYAIKKVWASIWNYRAYEEREFHKIVHIKTMMGVCCHLRYKGEKANGVAVTKNIFDKKRKGFYINSQIGEALVTNPRKYSIAEEIVGVIAGNRKDYVLQYINRSNMIKKTEKVIQTKYLEELQKSLEKIEEHFKKVYNIEKNSIFAMEIEFKITSNGILHIKQARPWVE